LVFFVGYCNRNTPESETIVKLDTIYHEKIIKDTIFKPVPVSVQVTDTIYDTDTIYPVEHAGDSIRTYIYKDSDSLEIITAKSLVQGVMLRFDLRRTIIPPPTIVITKEEKSPSVRLYGEIGYNFGYKQPTIGASILIKKLSIGTEYGNGIGFRIGYRLR